MSLVIKTTLGAITLALDAASAPETVKHATSLATQGMWNDTEFYRSDFVIQMGVHGQSNRHDPPKLSVNETLAGTRRSNVRGTASFAHWDVPDAGRAEFFINLGDNPHLDEAYGGFCVFAAVRPGDVASFGVVDAVAKSVRTGRNVGVVEVSYVGG